MKRRDFITAIAGATAWVAKARAQEPRRVIGLLSSITFNSYPGAEVAMARGLENTGFVEDKNISIIRRLGRWSVQPVALVSERTSEARGGCDCLRRCSGGICGKGRDFKYPDCLWDG